MEEIETQLELQTNTENKGNEEIQPVKPPSTKKEDLALGCSTLAPEARCAILFMYIFYSLYMLGLTKVHENCTQTLAGSNNNVANCIEQLAIAFQSRNPAIFSFNFMFWLNVFRIYY